MAEKRKILCTGTRKNRNGEIVNCKRIIAEVDYANDVRIEIKCGSCGTMNIIEARPKQRERQPLDLQTKDRLSNLGLFPIQEISV